MDEEDRASIRVGSDLRESFQVDGSLSLRSGRHSFVTDVRRRAGVTALPLAQAEQRSSLRPMPSSSDELSSPIRLDSKVFSRA
jgi:hypothetical protein